MNITYEMILHNEQFVFYTLVRCPSVKFFGNFWVKLNRLEFSPWSRARQAEGHFLLRTCIGTLSFTTQNFFQNKIKNHVQVKKRAAFTTDSLWMKVSLITGVSLSSSGSHLQWMKVVTFIGIIPIKPGPDSSEMLYLFISIYVCTVIF